MELPTSIQEIENNNLRCYRIENAAATAEIYAHGAHIAHWQPRPQQPVLWMSEHSHFEARQSIRGGVPICFPWFGPKSDDPNAPAHGLARTLNWQLKSASEDESATELIFVPAPEVAAQNGWPKLDIQLRVSIGEQLEISFEAHNKSASTCSYEIALHSYFAVSDVRNIPLNGLEDATYFDKVAFQRRFRWLMPMENALSSYKNEPPECEAENASLHFTHETDRIYKSASTCTLRDEAWQREIVIEKSHSLNTIVWNPWIEKAARMADFGDEEWTQMACIETANVGENHVILAPNESHSTSAKISARDLR